MTSERFTQRLEVIGWPAREVARRLDLPWKRVCLWMNGRYPVPDEVAAWIEQLATAHERTPVPQVKRAR